MSNKDVEFVMERYKPYNDTRGGSSLQGYITASYKSLCSLFGPPNSAGDDYKVSTEWVIQDQQTGKVFTIYDYKETNLYDESLPSVEDFRALPSYEWHIGGQSQTEIREFKEFLQEFAKTENSTTE